jgi:hypothetical protein
MKKNLIMSVLAIGIMAPGILAETTNYYFPSVFSTNPQGPWAWHYGPDIDHMLPMTSAGVDKWNSNGIRPSYNEYIPELRLQEKYGDNNAYLVFTCPETGLYSLDFSILATMHSVFSTGLCTYIDVYTSASSAPIWSHTKSWTGIGSYASDMRFQPELQQIPMNAGDEIILSFGIDNYLNYSEGVFQIKPSGLTPEVTPCIILGEEVVPTRYVYPGTFDTNPKNEWSLYCGADVSTMTPMTNSGTNYWTCNGIRPAYGEYGFQEFRTQDKFGDNNVYLVFTCPQTGKYSLKYRLMTNMQTLFEQYFGELETHYAVYKSTSVEPVWSTSFVWDYAHIHPLELGAVSSLQEIQMNEGEQIILMMGIDNKGNYNEAVFSLAPVSAGVLPFVEYSPNTQVRIPGDANDDGVVNVGDLGILAANYGGSDKTWEQGDFNGDGLVNVGDLGILAANYGSSGSSFQADYAKVFGSAVEDDNSETSGSLCSGLGLPLIAGLALMGLMWVKLEE